jgi:ATPase subunit of ABC transporter with duplicated ATPase domains
MTRDDRGDRVVSLLIPWLSLSNQLVVYPKGVTFNSPSEQEKPYPTTSAASDTVRKPHSPTKGAKEDISKLTQTLTIQLRGIASFLAPPQQSQSEFRTVSDDGDNVGASDESSKMPGMSKTQGNFKLSVLKGEFTDSQIIVMLGENGTGKTTFIRMLAGLLKIDSIEGIDVEISEFNVSYKPQKIRHLLHQKIHNSYMHSLLDVMKPSIDCAANSPQ